MPRPSSATLTDPSACRVIVTVDPPWLGSAQRVVTTLPRVKKWKPSVPWAWVSPNSEAFQPPKL